MKAFVILLLDTVCLATAQEDLDATGHFFRETLAHRLVWLNVHLTQQVLDILTPDALRHVLGGRDLSIQQGYSEYIGQAVISLFFGLHILFVALLAATDNMISHIKNLDLNPL